MTRACCAPGSSLRRAVTLLVLSINASVTGFPAPLAPQKADTGRELVGPEMSFYRVGQRSRGNFVNFLAPFRKNGVISTDLCSRAAHFIEVLVAPTSASVSRYPLADDPPVGSRSRT